jgi:regulator of sigma E protease
MELLHSLLFFVIAIGVLVTVHEFGHFWVARRLGVKVLRFSVGFGPALLRREARDGTEYVLAAVPLGGYVKMLDESETEVPAGELHRAFNRKPLWVRAAVVVAGPVFNFVFAVLAYTAMFMLGISGLKPVVGDVASGSLAARAGLTAGQELVAIDGRPVATWEAVIHRVVAHALDGSAAQLTLRGDDGRSREVSLDLGQVAADDLTRGQFFDSLGITARRPLLAPRIGRVVDDGAAQAAGLRARDVILSADGEAIPDWSAWVEYVRARPGQPIEVLLRRSDGEHRLTITPRAVQDDGEEIGRIGATVADAEITLQRYYAVQRHGVYEALMLGFSKTWEMSVLTLKMIWRMVTLDVSVENLSGPISIAQYAGVSADIGLSRFIGFLAVVSISLGILNLLPIPLLDGGHLFFYAIEAIRRKPVSEDLLYVGQRLGIALLVGLMGLAFYNDLARVFG